jgi:hypothetical protein
MMAEKHCHITLILQLPWKRRKQVKTGMFEDQLQHFRLVVVNDLRNQ